MEKRHKNKYQVFIECVDGNFNQYCIGIRDTYDYESFYPLKETELLEYVKEYVGDFSEISLGHVMVPKDLELTYSLAKAVLEIVEQYKPLV